jgi:hypothetical protein
MRASEFISKRQILEADFLRPGQSVAEFISENARPWLEASNNGHWVVYRGIWGQNDSVFPRVIRNNPFTFPEPDKSHDPRAEPRRPMDTPEVRHQAFNAVIKSVGGIANRSNSAFVTHDAKWAGNYGEPYVFMPLGDFHYTWSPVYRDWTADFNGNDLIKLMRPDAPFDEEKILKRAQKEIQDFLNSARYSTDPVTLAQAEEVRDTNSKAYKELLSFYRGHAKYYFGFSTNPEAYDPALVSKKIQVDQGLDQAIRSGNEIMITAKTGLYIKSFVYGDVMEPLWQGEII